MIEQVRPEDFYRTVAKIKILVTKLESFKDDISKNSVYQLRGSIERIDQLTR